MQVRSFEKLSPEIIPEPPSAILLPSGKRSPLRPRRQRPAKQKLEQTTIRNRILMVGRIRELALYRAEVLRHAGFEVRTPEDIEAARAIIERGDLDVAVLSYTLPNNTVQEIADQVREHCPDCPIIAIAESGRVDRRIAPEAIALAADGPPGLLSALDRVLKLS
jgi:CheY-like chemotaxis protein